MHIHKFQSLQSFKLFKGLQSFNRTRFGIIVLQLFKGSGLLNNPRFAEFTHHCWRGDRWVCRAANEAQPCCIRSTILESRQESPGRISSGNASCSSLFLILTLRFWSPLWMRVKPWVMSGSSIFSHHSIEISGKGVDWQILELKRKPQRCLLVANP